MTDPLAKVDPAKLGQRNTPEADWGEPLEGDAQYWRQPRLAREDRPGGGPRAGLEDPQATKDQISRRT